MPMQAPLELTRGSGVLPTDSGFTYSTYMEPKDWPKDRQLLRTEVGAGGATKYVYTYPGHGTPTTVQVNTTTTPTVKRLLSSEFAAVVSDASKVNRFPRLRRPMGRKVDLPAPIEFLEVGEEA